MTTTTVTKLSWEDTTRYRVAPGRYPDAIVILQNPLENHSKNYLVQTLRKMRGVSSVRFSRRLRTALLVKFNRRILDSRDLIDCVRGMYRQARLIECS